MANLNTSWGIESILYETLVYIIRVSWKTEMMSNNMAQVRCLVLHISNTGNEQTVEAIHIVAFGRTIHIVTLHFIN